MFQLGHDFTQFPANGSFYVLPVLIQNLCILQSESVEFFHASLYRWCLKNKLTLDLSRYIWKRLLGDNRCCNFFPHC